MVNRTECDMDAASVDAHQPLRFSLGWWLRAVENGLLLNFATFLMAGSVAVMFYEATSRSLLSASHWWAEELVRFLVVWSVMLSFGVATRHGNYIRMDLLVGALPRTWRQLTAWMNCLAGLAFSILLTIAGVQSVTHLQQVGMMTESNLDLPLWVVRLCLPIGGFLYGTYFAGLAVALLRGREETQAAAH